MNKNYYEQLKSEYASIQQLYAIAEAEKNGTIPQLAGPVLCYIGKEGFEKKPKEKKDVIFQRSRYSYIHLPGGNVLKNRWSIEDIKEYLENGHSIQNGEFREPYEFRGEKKWTFTGNQFIHANMVIVDIDELNPSVENLLNYAKPHRPTMIYETLSYSETKKKYRVLFLLDRLVNSIEYQTITQYLINKFPGADQACKDPGRLYFGGKYVPFFEGNFLKADDVLNLPESKLIRIKIEEGKISKTKVKTGKMIEEKIEIDRKKIAENLKSISVNYEIKQIEDVKALEFINNLPLDKIIGVEFGDTFRCIMPDHHDNNPSSIIMEINGKQRYKCHGCSDTRTKSVINTIMSILGLGLKEAILFTLDCMGIQYSSKHRCEALATIQFNRIFLTKNQDTEIYKKLKNSRLLGTYIAFTNYMENYLPEHPVEEGKISMFASLRHLSKTFKDWDLKGTDISRISRKMNDLVLYGLLEKVDYKDLPESLRVKSLEFQSKNNLNYAVTYWRMPELTDDILDRAIEIIKEEKSVGYTKEHLNRVQMFRLHGEDAESVYNQDELNFSKSVNKSLSMLMSSFIQRQGYFTKQQLMDHSDLFDKKIHQYLPGVAKDLNLQYVTINKEISEKLDIQLPRNSKIYIKK